MGTNVQLEYDGAVSGAGGATYSCDKMQLIFRLRRDEPQRLLDTLAAALWLEFDHWASYRFGTYRNQFRIVCGDGVSFWLGVGLVGDGKSRPDCSCKVEFNPNKVGRARQLRWLLRQLWHRASLVEPCRCKQWDLAVDWPEPREWYTLAKDARLYEEYRASRADRTQYAGTRNRPGRCKLYNKQVESGLAAPMTRLELTVGGLATAAQVAALWPVVYRLRDVQASAEVAALNDTDRFILATLLDAPDRLQELGRRKRQKFAGLLHASGYRVALDVAAYDAVLRGVTAWTQPPAPDCDGLDRAAWEWVGCDPAYRPEVRAWPGEVDELTKTGLTTGGDDGAQ